MGYSELQELIRVYADRHEITVDNASRLHLGGPSADGRGVS